MRVRASSTSALVVSLLANDVLAAVHRRHGHFHHKNTELTVTDDIIETKTETIYVTVDWPGGQTIGVEYPTDWPKQGASPTSTKASTKASVPQYTETSGSSVTDTFVAPPTSTSVAKEAPPSTTSTHVDSPQHVQEPTTTSTPSAAVPTTMATVIKSPATPAAAAPANTPAGSYSGSGSGSPSTGSSKKRGLAYNDASLTQFFTGANSEVTWAYNWGQTTSGLAPGLQYIPMLWSNSADKTGSWSAHASAAIASGSTHLFSFNEPDLGGQANMAVNVAAQAFMTYMQPFAGKAKLGAPAVTNGGGATGLNYLSSFLSACTGCTIDFVNIHWYDSATNYAYFKSHVEQAYQTGGGRPVWITEFAASGTPDEQNTFLEVVIPWLDSQPYVEGYAYFMCSDGVLVNGNGNGASSLGGTFMSYSASTISALIADA